MRHSDPNEVILSALANRRSLHRLGCLFLGLFLATVALWVCSLHWSLNFWPSKSVLIRSDSGAVSIKWNLNPDWDPFNPHRGYPTPMLYVEPSTSYWGDGLEYDFSGQSGLFFFDMRYVIPTF